MSRGHSEVGLVVAAWKQFGQPSSVFVGRDDTIYIGASYRAPSTPRPCPPMGARISYGPSLSPGDSGIWVSELSLADQKRISPESRVNWNLGSSLANGGETPYPEVTNHEGVISLSRKSQRVIAASWAKNCA